MKFTRVAFAALVCAAVGLFSLAPAMACPCTGDDSPCTCGSGCACGGKH